MSRAARLLAAAALLAATTPALAFRRTESEQAVGRCLWWNGKSVRYVLNASAANTVGCADQNAAMSLARASFATWSQARALPGAAPGTDFAFADGGTSRSTVVGYDPRAANENLVVWRKGTCTAPPEDTCHAVPGACGDKYNCWEHGATTIGLTTTNYRPDTGEIVDADMELFDRDAAQGTGYWFTCAGSGSSCGTTGPQPTTPTGACVSMDLGSTVTHESGHMLGLAHNCEGLPCADITATMFASAAIGELTKRTLKADDVAGVCTIYPFGLAASQAGGVGESGATCAALPAPEPERKTGCGCASAGPSDAAMLLLLAALARARRRITG